ncbi:hypothetical protein [Limnohabitans sp.]|uniref:hypothetical protein n=1 Tax=Limnohabitans sp. TaxID=1907725 RepID=UPI00286F2E05|nr:hypothetical protein [Limnohabitans sp.]
MTATTLKEKIELGFKQTIIIIKQLRDATNAKIGTLTALTTTDKTSVVAAINELQTTIAAKPSINDAETQPTSTWSSQKTHDEITGAITALINGADADADSLKELADKITALAQTDTGLVSAGSSQAFTDDQKATARANIGAVSAADIGSMSTVDFAAVIDDEWAKNV